MVNRRLNQERKTLYQNLKKSFQNDNTFVLGSMANTTDFVVLDVMKDVQLVKIVVPDEIDNVSIWIDKLRKIYALSWYKAEYILIYVDDDMKEVKRRSVALR